ncbi:MAG: signal recognition particle-docking protein FtsY [Pseudomonadales bacterium]|nr:signal recognition particle-docking protein FtsY [Pseudomonadales bacterium]
MGNQTNIFNRYFDSSIRSSEHCKIQVGLADSQDAGAENVIFLRFFEIPHTPSVARLEPSTRRKPLAGKEPSARKEPTTEQKQIVKEAPEASAPEALVSETLVSETIASEAIIPESLLPETKENVFQRIKKGLGRTRASFSDGLSDLLLGKKAIDDDLMEEIETQLLVADVGLDATTRIVASLTQKVGRKELADSEALYAALQQELRDILAFQNDTGFLLNTAATPQVLLVVGVNGVGKATTIGKLAKRFQLEGKSVMLAAGDTFRAAAVEQLQAWGERNQVPVVAQHTGADSASVIFDALASAKAKGIDILIADTAGRLHTKRNLMEELKKVKRVMGKIDEAAPHEVLLVVDAGTGQNALNQVEQFHETLALTGIALTKLDGTAKGGIVFAMADKMDIPIRFIGVGEQIDDLRPFDADDFVTALFQ